MHVVLANQWYPPETGGGGVATHNYYFAKACVQLGHQVTVVSQRPNPDVPMDTTRDGVRIIRIPSISLYRFKHVPVIGRQFRFLQGLHYSWMLNKTLRELHQTDPIDVVEFAEVNAEGFFWRRGIGHSMIVRCHTPSFVLARYYQRSEMPYDTNGLGWAERSAIRHANGRTAPSADLAQIISHDCALPLDNIRVIPNALDTDGFVPLKDRPTHSQLQILFVGRLERTKGIDVLLEAIPTVCAMVPSAHFSIAGSARGQIVGQTYGDYLQATMPELVSNGRVKLLGFVPDDHLVSLYQQSDICVVPSLLYESFSLTCAQAMACGVPIIASRIGGIPETLDRGNCGILVEPGNAQALADALIDTANNPALRSMLAQRGREFAENTFSANKVAQQTLDYYRQVM